MPGREGEEDFLGGMIGKKDDDEREKAKPSRGRHPGIRQAPVGPQTKEDNSRKSEEASQEKGRRLESEEGADMLPENEQNGEPEDEHGGGKIVGAEDVERPERIPELEHKHGEDGRKRQRRKKEQRGAPRGRFARGVCMEQGGCGAGGGREEEHKAGESEKATDGVAGGGSVRRIANCKNVTDPIEARADDPAVEKKARVRCAREHLRMRGAAKGNVFCGRALSLGSGEERPVVCVQGLGLESAPEDKQVRGISLRAVEKNKAAGKMIAGSHRGGRDGHGRRGGEMGCHPHGDGGAHGMTHEDRAGREDLRAVSEFRKQVDSASLGALRRERVAAVAVSGEIDEKGAKPEGGKAFAEVLHDAAIGGDAVKDDDGAGWICRARLDDTNGNPAVTGGNDDIANGERRAGGEPGAAGNAKKTEKRSDGAAVHWAYMGRQNGA